MVVAAVNRKREWGRRIDRTIKFFTPFFKPITTGYHPTEEKLRGALIEDINSVNFPPLSILQHTRWPSRVTDNFFPRLRQPTRIKGIQKMMKMMKRRAYCCLTIFHGINHFGSFEQKKCFDIADCMIKGQS